MEEDHLDVDSATYETVNSPLGCIEDYG
jgi:hypothetical protein